MKKLLIFFIGVIPMSNCFSQDATDALRYSQDEIKGSARFAAMSGAFGALGGDLSAVSINPAGAAIFTRSYASVTFGALKTNNDVNYFGGLSSSDSQDFDLQQGGGAFVFQNNNLSSPWKKLVMSVAFDEQGNFDDDWFAVGTNTRSVDQYFLSFAQGQRLDEISAFPDESLNDAYREIGEAYGYGNQQAFLGYESFIIDPVNDTDDNTAYVSSLAPGQFFQDYSYISTGYNGKFSFNIATQYGENLFLGLNLNAHSINFERSTYLFESNSNAGSAVTEIGFENNLLTTGNGFSFQLGGILKLSPELRAGLTYSSPTWFSILEETTQFISTTVDDGNSSFIQTINPRIINLFPEYRLKTPGKVSASLAYVFDEKGLISFDYGYKDFGKMEFRPTSDPVFQAQNRNIENNFKAASTYKFGAEYRLNAWSFRGGYRFEESPYKDDSVYGNLTGYSLGLGYSFGAFKLDMAYTNSRRDYRPQLYAVGLTDTASIDTNNSNIILSLGFSL